MTGQIKVYVPDALNRQILGDLVVLYGLDHQIMLCDSVKDVQAALLVHGDSTGNLSPKNVFYSPVRAGTLIQRLARLVRGADYDPADDIILFGAYQMDIVQNALIPMQGGTAILLTEKERDILLRLYRNQGDIVDRQELLDDIWGYGENIETHTLETHIYRIRQKIEKDPARPVILLTEGTGYRLATT